MAFQDDELSRLFLMAGLGMIGAPSLAQGVSRGGMFALQDMDNQKELKARQRLADAKLKEEDQQAKAREIALARAQQLQTIMGGGGTPQVQPAGSQRSVVDAPGWTPQVAPAPQANIGQMLLKGGFVDEAKKYADAEAHLHGEAYGGIQMTQAGKPYYMTKQGPRYVADNSFVPREELHFGDTGDRSMVGVDKFTGKEVSPGFKKNMSAVEQDASSRGWANVNLAREQFNRGELRDVPLPDGSKVPAFVTPQGMKQVPGTAPARERLHDSAAEKLLTLDQMMHSGQVALSELKTNGGTGPVIGRLPDFMANYFDPKGMKSRQFLSDLTTQITLARSGAAVTESEYKRLRPFLADPADSDAVAQGKVENLMKEYGQIRQARSTFYSSQGYKVPEATMGLSDPLKGGGKIKSGAEIEADLMAELERRKKRGG